MKIELDSSSYSNLVSILIFYKQYCEEQIEEKKLVTAVDHQKLLEVEDLLEELYEQEKKQEVI